MTINDFHKIVKSWLDSNIVTSESSDRNFHLHKINAVQNNLVLISIKETVTWQWLPLKFRETLPQIDQSFNILCLKTHEDGVDWKKGQSYSKHYCN